LPASAELYDPASERWTTTGSLATSRSQHTATLLSNGKVLVVGGLRFFSDLASAELYDPASGTWTPTGSLTSLPRHGHTATLVPNGKVLVTGGFYDDLGYAGFSLAAAELYDPASGTWTSTGSLATARDRHTATLLPNGKVLVAGGANSSVSRGDPAIAELYDPTSGTWTATGSLATERVGHTATLLPNGKVLVVGGSYGSQLASAELYEPASGTWTATGSPATERAYHTATLLPSDKVLVAGGYNYPNGLPSAELYDPASGTWLGTGSLVTARYSHTATLLPNGKVLVAAGFNGTSYFASAELYGQPTPTLLNISTRMRVQTGDNAIIGGFIITGTQPKTVIVRGLGPSLAVPGALADPVIEVHGSSGELLATNDNWRDAATRQQIIDSGLAPSNDLESALWGVINPGAYTVILAGKNGGTGVGLVEVYDLDRTVDSKLANISTRGFVDTGDNVMIGGFIVSGGSPLGTARVLVRALGPSIPVAGALGDPTLELHDGSGTMIAFNDNWKTRPDGSSQQAEIEATTIPPTSDLESALVQTFAPGNYTVIVRGTSNTAGVGLVDVYNLQ
jgi:Galactose oxidase, central domain/Kelch motif